MSPEDIVKKIATSPCFQYYDDGGNRVCSYCGCFRDFNQRSPNTGGPGTHRPECLWISARKHLT